MVNDDIIDNWEFNLPCMRELMYSDEFTFILKDKKILIDYMPIDVISMLNLAVLINVDKSFMKEKK